MRILAVSIVLSTTSIAGDAMADAVETGIEAPQDESTRFAGTSQDPETAAPKLLPSVSAIQVHGDARLRYESTSGQTLLPDRQRGVLRGRLGARYQVNNRIRAGARITTGDPDDPNSSDVTLGSFVDDLNVSLDQAFIEYRGEQFTVVGGKFSNPFVRTDLVWDGDVSPLGMAASSTIFDRAGTSLQATGIYFVIDEQTLAGDSDMLGGQLSLSLDLQAKWNLGLSVAYYDYSIGSLASADSGDTRDNFLTTDGSAYLSDFDLLDTVLELTFAGPNEQWPISVQADYVKNLGARTAEDTGYSGALTVGRLHGPGDWRLSYGYTVAESDAVLAAFSNDNTSFGTNYRQHALSVDYGWLEKTYLNLTVYYYRRENVELIPSAADDFISRVRLNISLAF